MNSIEAQHNATFLNNFIEAQNSTYFDAVGQKIKAMDEIAMVWSGGSLVRGFITGFTGYKTRERMTHHGVKVPAGFRVTGVRVERDGKRYTKEFDQLVKVA